MEEERDNIKETNNIEKAFDDKFSAELDRVMSQVLVDAYRNYLSGITPVKIYHTKSRGNTTVIFENGSSITVKKMKGEKDCLETALAYALMKKAYPRHMIKKLLEETEEK